MSAPFSFIILTFNEEMHLPQLLGSLTGLDAPVYVLDSGSTDRTVEIATAYGAVVEQHTFENHPRQWHHALTNFPIDTEWVIGLDADQVVSPELKAQLQAFDPQKYADVNGIYFNRKYIFKGQWIKHGGYYPFYQLKMFRSGVGFSDLNENMDHRFVAPGNTVIWKNGWIIEENQKENNIAFWIDKHNRYSDLIAHEEVERMKKLRTQTVEPRFWGSPDQRTAWRKRLWWKTPRFIRPFFYFIHRLIFKLGFLDGRTGIMYHFMQAFWFRMVVDIKIGELLKEERNAKVK